MLSKVATFLYDLISQTNNLRLSNAMGVVAGEVFLQPNEELFCEYYNDLTVLIFQEY